MRLRLLNLWDHNSTSLLPPLRRPVARGRALTTRLQNTSLSRSSGPPTAALPGHRNAKRDRLSKARRHHFLPLPSTECFAIRVPWLLLPSGALPSSRPRRMNGPILSPAPRHVNRSLPVNVWVMERPRVAASSRAGPRLDTRNRVTSRHAQALPRSARHRRRVQVLTGRSV